MTKLRTAAGGAARQKYEDKGYADAAASGSFRISECPYADGWQRDAWQAGAWRWMEEKRKLRDQKGRDIKGHGGSQHARKIGREVDEILAKGPSSPRGWGPVAKVDAPPARGAVVDVDNQPYTVAPAAIRDTRSSGYDMQFAKIARINQDDAWLVISPRGDVLGCIVGTGMYWSIYRRSDGLPWRKDQEAEITYYRSVEGDWKSVVFGIARLTL